MRKSVFNVSDQVTHKLGDMLVSDLCDAKEIAAHLRGDRTADLRLCFRICEIRFSHDAANFILTK